MKLRTVEYLASVDQVVVIEKVFHLGSANRLYQMLIKSETTIALGFYRSYCVNACPIPLAGSTAYNRKRKGRYTGRDAIEVSEETLSTKQIQLALTDENRAVESPILLNGDCQGFIRATRLSTMRSAYVHSIHFEDNVFFHPSQRWRRETWPFQLFHDQKEQSLSLRNICMNSHQQKSLDVTQMRETNDYFRQIRIG